MNIIYCGFGRAGVECLYQLLSQRNISPKNLFVFCHKGDNNFILELDKYSIKYSQKHINNCAKEIERFNPQYLISVYYKFIITNKILDIVNYRAINCHPSLLPNYKGCFSCPWVILNGENKTGISFHYMKSKVDKGNIILQKEIDIKEHDTAFSLYHKLVSLFILYFNQAFNLLTSGEIGEVQKHEGSYYERKLPFNGSLDAQKISFDFAKKFVRAMHFPPYNGALFVINNKQIEINSIEVLHKYKGYFND